MIGFLLGSLYLTEFVIKLVNMLSKYAGTDFTLKFEGMLFLIVALLLKR